MDASFNADLVWNGTEVQESGVAWVQIGFFVFDNCISALDPVDHDGDTVTWLLYNVGTFCRAWAEALIPLHRLDAGYFLFVLVCIL